MGQRSSWFDCYYSWPNCFAESKKNKSEGKVDTLGMLVLILTAGSLFMGLILGQQLGFMSLIFLSLMIMTIILLFGFIYLEKRAPNPVINFHLFNNVDFSLSLLATILVYGINFVVNIIEPIYLEQNRLISTDLAGLILISFPIIQIIVSPFAGWLSDKFGSHFIAAISLAMLIISQAGLATVNHTTSLGILCVWLGFVGLGNGLFQAPTNVLVMNSVTKDQLGIASGLLGFSRNTGMTIGAIFANILLFSGISMNLGHSTIDYPVAQPSAFIFGMRFTFWITAAVLLGLFIAQLTVNFRRKNA